MAIFASPNSLKIDHLHRILHFLEIAHVSKLTYPKQRYTRSGWITIQSCNSSRISREKSVVSMGDTSGSLFIPENSGRLDVQPLLDRIRARLLGWKGKLLSSAGRETLVKTVLSSQPIYHMTVFPELKWLIKKINRMRRSFLWRGETPNKVYGRHSLVNWPTSCRPKIKGGSGILDLERFACARDYDGFGSNGGKKQELGTNLKSHAMTEIGTFSWPQRWCQ